MQAEAEKQDKQLQNNITVAEIRAAGYGSTVDIDQNQMSDFRDAMKEIRELNNIKNRQIFKERKKVIEVFKAIKKMILKEKSLQVQREIADKQLEIARENKNKYDVKSSIKRKNST
jgi:hypothetical protein